MQTVVSIVLRLFVLASFAWSSLGVTYAVHVCSKMGRIGLFETCAMDHGVATQRVAETESCCSDLDEADDTSEESAQLTPAASDHCCRTELSSLPTTDTFAPVSSILHHNIDASSALVRVPMHTDPQSVQVRRTVSDSSPPGIRDLSISNSILRI